MHIYAHRPSNTFFPRSKGLPCTRSGLCALCTEATGLAYYDSLIIDFPTAILFPITHFL